VTNTGAVAGSEIAQLYARRTAVEPTNSATPRRLVGFERIALAPGETKTAVFEVPAAHLRQWAERPDGSASAAGGGAGSSVTFGELAVPPGSHEFAVGRSSTDLPAIVDLELP
jgi:hypothetical protein